MREMQVKTKMRNHFTVFRTIIKTKIVLVRMRTNILIYS